MRSDDFQFLASLLKQHSGLMITEDKLYLLEARLMPVARRHDLNGLADICQRLRGQGDSKLKDDVVETMVVGDTAFFRDTKPFEQFRQFVLPKLLQVHASKKRLRIWSAGTASGQEAYSLAMLLQAAAADLTGWEIELIGTDFSREMIERAKQGIYSQFEVQRSLSIHLLLKYFTQQGDQWQLNENIRQMVQYRPLNLLEDFSGLGNFDVIFCRNVLSSFDQPTKSRVLHGLARQLAPHGYSFLGAAETVLGLGTRFKPAENQRGIYALEPEEPATMFKAV